MIRIDQQQDPTDGTIAVTFSLIFERPVSVVGDFNGWSPGQHELLGANGNVETTIRLSPGRYAFRYLAEGGMFFDDPDTWVESNGIGGSHCVLEIAGDEPVVDITASEAVLRLEPVASAVSSDTTAIDDLTKIDGLGPKANTALHAAGITTFVKLAELSVDEIKRALAASKVKSATGVQTWAAQALQLSGATAKPTASAKPKPKAAKNPKPTAKAKALR